MREWSTVRWLSVEVLSFKGTLPNCDSRSRAQLVGLPNCDTISFFFIEGFESHCDMQMYRTRTSAIDNRLNFGPQLLSMNIYKISVQLDWISALQSAPNRGALNRSKTLQIASNRLKSLRFGALWSDFKRFGAILGDLKRSDLERFWAILSTLKRF